MKSYCLFAVLSFVIPRALGTCSGNETSAAVLWNCGTGDSDHTNCSSLNDALNFTLHLAANCSGQNLTAEIYLNSNTTLDNTIFIKDIAEFRLLGSKSKTVVTCDKGAALNFAGNTQIPMNIEIQNLSFQNCGNGTAALVFSGNRDVTFYYLMVANSNGSGLLLENISGAVIVRNSSFENNSFHLQRRFGAGVHISSIQSQSTITFENCNFTGNQAINDSKGNLDNLDIGGGGMCIVFSGKNASISISNCRFSQNVAQNGAGLFASYMGRASNNNLVITATEFLKNYYKKGDPFNSGGGAMVVTANHSNNNTLLFQRCTFSGNSATWGGALQLFSIPLKPLSESMNHFRVVNSTFVENKATVGSAINIYCNSAATSPELCNTLPLIEGDSFFTCNGHDHSTYSTLNINGFPTSISGTISFRGNFGSPLLVHKTAAVINEQSLLMFDNNSAQTGGAISLYDSWITVSSGTRLSFNNNTAYIDGGAIYAHQSKQLYVPYAHNCFIQYSSNTTDPPCRWNSSFEFNGNRARNQTNSIYATSIIPCVWKRQNDTSLSDSIKATFCKWPHWTFHGHNICTDQISTSIRNLSYTPDSVQLSPGIPKQFIFGVDDLGHNVTALSIIASLEGLSPGMNIVKYTDEGLVVKGRKSKNLTVRIQVDDDRLAYKTVDISIGDCPPGFAFSSESLSCKCFEDKRQFLQCHGRGWKASLRNGFCITYSEIKHANQTVYGRCVFTVFPLTHGQSHYLPLPEDAKDLDERLCGLYKRRGLLCGKCIKGFSIDSLSTTYKCHNTTTCLSSAAKNWAIYLALNGLPTLAMFMVILLLHVSLTGGATNGFIFFSQVLTLSQELFVLQSTSEGSNIHGAQALTSFLVNFYSIWSLDLYRIYHSFAGHPLCLGEELRVIDILALHYLSALYPFILIVVAYIVIELHARNCRIFVCLWKPLCLICTRFRLSLKAQTSVVDAFATFIILSYVKIVRISLLLITYTSIRKMENDSQVKLVSNYDPTIVFMSKEHMPFIISGTFCLLTFGLLPPLLLLFYQCRVVQRCLDRCKMNRLGLKTFMDAFQGCYKDGRNGGPDRRFFAGLYLVYRVVIFVIFNLQIPYLIGYYNLLVVCIVIVMLIAFLQPYKKKFFNHLDIFFTCLLAVFFGLHILGFSYLESTLKVPAAILIVAYCICTIPLIYLSGLVLKKLYRLLCHSKRLRCSVGVPHIMRNFCQKVQHGCSINRQPQPKQFVTYTEVAISDDSIPEQLASPHSKVTTHCEDNVSTWESGYGSII